MTRRLTSRPAPSQHAERAPRLALRFALCAALVFALGAAAIVVVVRHGSMIQAQRHALERGRFAAQTVLSHELRPADLRARPSERRRRALRRLFEARVLVGGIEDATLYTAEGRLTYSTVGPEAERRVPPRLPRDALAGVASSEVVRSGPDGSLVLRTYVPLVVGSSRTAGVVAFDEDDARIETMAWRSSLLAAGVLEALLLGLFLVLAPGFAAVTARIRRHVAELEHVATHDVLVEMPNRLGFQRAAREVLASRPGGAVLLIDIDGFSEVDEVLGHESGDALLSLVADRLRKELAECDVLARLGEDEFGVLLRDDSHAAISAIVERVERALEEPFLVDDIQIAVSASFGAALLGEAGGDLTAALRGASAALSTAKVPEAANLQIYDPEHDSDDKSVLTLTAELRDAFSRGQLLVHFQPQADLATREIRGVEALVRWQHPARGLLTAAAFVTQAERGGLARVLRTFVLETSARHWQEWRDLGIELDLAVNLSTADMLDVSLPEEIEALLLRHRIPPSTLVLEITERTVVADERRNDQVVERLRRAGVRLAIDDFGTGESSLAALRRFPVAQIKLDRRLLADVPGDAAAEAIVASVVDIGHALGATVVAEGIETPEQWRQVFMLGCDLAQGFLLGKPLPPEDVPAFLEATPVVRRRTVAHLR